MSHVKLLIQEICTENVLLLLFIQIKNSVVSASSGRSFEFEFFHV